LAKVGRSSWQAARADDAGVAGQCREETGLPVRVEHEIGRRAHPVTGQQVVYLACTLTTTAVRTPPSPELVELRWLDLNQVEDLMPDLHPSVRRYLHLRYRLHPTRHGHGSRG